MLALVFQLSVLPSMAHARGETIVLCTPQGAVAVSLDHAGQPAEPAPAASCQHCMAAHVAAPPIPGVQSVTVRYAARTVPPASMEQGRPVARAPPRPPSQGPPVLIQA